MLVLQISVMNKSRDFYCLVNKSTSVWERRGIHILNAFNLRADKSLILSYSCKHFKK